MENLISYKLDGFEGPLDLLLQLISKNKLNIYDIKLTVLVDQYLKQINIMKEAEMEISSEFIEMASRLLYMKTVSLLPKHDELEQLKDELSGELLEYSLCRQMAEKLSNMTDGFDKFVRPQENIEYDNTYVLIHDANVLYESYLAAVGRGQRKMPASVEPFKKIVAKKIFSVSAKIAYVMRNLYKSTSKKLSSLYKTAKSRSELVATFLAVLELCKANRIKINGSDENADITLLKEDKNEN